MAVLVEIRGSVACPCLTRTKNGEIYYPLVLVLRISVQFFVLGESQCEGIGVKLDVEHNFTIARHASTLMRV